MNVPPPEPHLAWVRETGLEQEERASLEDIECQKYALFFLARFVSDRNVLLLMVSAQAEKDTDYSQNHTFSAEGDGIQAMLRLVHAPSTDEGLQYKAARTVGHLASNAIRL